MEPSSVTAESVFQHHLNALVENDLEALMMDYTEQSEIWTPEGEMVGLEGISSFFSYAFTLFPAGKTKFDLKKITSKNDKVFIIWTADSQVVTVPFATDSFEIRNGKIIWQSTAFQMVQK